MAGYHAVVGTRCHVWAAHWHVHTLGYLPRDRKHPGLARASGSFDDATGTGGSVEQLPVVASRAAVAASPGFAVHAARRERQERQGREL